MTKQFTITRKDLYNLYHLKNKSTLKIAKIYDCNYQTICNRLSEFKIPRKSICQTRMRYKKFDFLGTIEEKAYLIGFRLGDLSVYKATPHSETIVVSCHTTQNVQVSVIKKMFEKYGKVTISDLKNNHFYVNCFLNLTFDFLLPKKDDIPSWIYKNNKAMSSFLAGYTDAEGNFIINQGRARFKIDSYDRNILKKIYFWLNRNEIITKFRLIGKKGEFVPVGYKYNKDLWRLNVNKAESLKKFISLIKPYMLHKKRIRGAILSLKNIQGRE